MNERATAPRWFPLLVGLAVVAGVALAFWFYRVIT